MAGTALEFHIRPATIDDVDTILALIVDLAVYEKEPDAVEATPELLRKNLFSSTPYANALLAFHGPSSAPGDALGLALYFFNYSTWTGRPGLYLEDLFVKPDTRGLGVGKALFAALAKIAQERDCARMDWSVLKWNTPSIEFYEKRLGAKMMDEWAGMRLEEATGGIERLRKFAAAVPLNNSET